MKQGTKILAVALVIAIISISSLVYLKLATNSFSSEYSVTDHLGRTVQFTSQPQKIVTLHPIATQIIYAIGANTRLIALDDMSINNQWLKKIDPTVTQKTSLSISGEPNVEAILALAPDLVIIGAYTPSYVTKLADANLTVVAFNFHNRTTTDSIELIGQATGNVEQATLLINYINIKEATVTSVTEQFSRDSRPLVMYQSSSTGSGLITTFHTGGNQAFQDSLITRAGGINMAENLTGIWFNIPTEQVMTWNPEFIFTGYSTSGVPQITLQDLKNDPVLCNLEAVKNNNFFMLPAGEFTSSTNCPESILALMFMAQKMYPNQFSNINMEQEIKDFYSTFYHYSLSDSEVTAILYPS